jgi:hypothetical protein
MQSVSLMRKYFYVVLAIALCLIFCGMYKIANDSNILYAIVFGLVALMFWGHLVVMAITDKDLSDHQ